MRMLWAHAANDNRASLWRRFGPGAALIALAGGILLVLLTAL